MAQPICNTFELMRQALRGLGYVEGQNISFEFRWAEGKLDQCPTWRSNSSAFGLTSS